MVRSILLYLALVLILVPQSLVLGQATVGSQATPPPTAAPSPPPPVYGPPIGLSEARKAIDAAEKVAVKEGWPVAIAVVDTGGYLVAFIKLDNTQLGSVEVAIQKARTSALYKRTTKEFEDRLALGGANLKVLNLPGLPIEGGVPIIVDGKLIGAIGVSGVQSSQDAQAAAAGAAVLVTTKGS